MKLTKLLSVAGITGGVILAAAAPAFAHNDNHPDPCPGQHVSIYAGAVVAAATQTATTTTTTPAATLPGGDLPHTGTNTTLPLTLLGVGLLILGAGTLTLRRRTNR